MEAPPIETMGLTKQYGDVAAVVDLNLRVEEGEIFGFLGPNGSGKTTTILMLLGLTEPTTGTARVFGFDPTREPLKVKRIVGYLPENLGFYEDLTARQNLTYTARLNGLPREEIQRRVEDALNIVGLPDVMDERVETFSRGMKQRLGIADVLVKAPKLVFLDEPTQGIDPDGVRKVLDLITRLNREQGMTVLLSSHLLYQVQMICRRVGIMSKGRLVAKGAIETLGEELRGEGMTFEVEVSRVEDDLIQRLEALPGVRKVEGSGNTLIIKSDGDVRQEILRSVLESGQQLLELKTVRRTLEEIYIRYFREA